MQALRPLITRAEADHRKHPAVGERDGVTPGAGELSLSRLVHVFLIRPRSCAAMIPGLPR